MSEVAPTRFQVLTTERLRVLRFQPGDLDACLMMRSDPELARYQSWRAM